MTDYPDTDLIENLRYNIHHCGALLPKEKSIIAEGYLWGAATSPLTACLPSQAQPTGFDLLILADLLFNHSEHEKLLSTVQSTLKKTRDVQALVFFTPYRPWLLEKDLAFFDLAKQGGFEVEKIFEKVMEKVMFEEDPGVSKGYLSNATFFAADRHANTVMQDELLRRTVFGYSLHWSEAMLR